MNKFLYLLLLLLSANYQLKHLPILPVSASVGVSNTASVLPQPEGIVIPKLGLRLGVMASPVVNGEWIISDKKTAFYGTGSSLVARPGTTVVFAHAKTGLFARLFLLKEHDTVGLIADNTLYLYTVTHHLVIGPEEVGFITKEGKSRLALFTCYGFNDAKRIVYFANFVEKVPLESKNNVLYDI